jgi:hypothetical protein
MIYTQNIEYQNAADTCFSPFLKAVVFCRVATHFFDHCASPSIDPAAHMLQGNASVEEDVVLINSNRCAPADRV